MCLDLPYAKWYKSNLFNVYHKAQLPMHMDNGKKCSRTGKLDDSTAEPYTTTLHLSVCGAHFWPRVDSERLTVSKWRKQQQVSVIAQKSKRKCSIQWHMRFTSVDSKPPVVTCSKMLAAAKSMMSSKLLQYLKREHWIGLWIWGKESLKPGKCNKTGLLRLALSVGVPFKHLIWYLYDHATAKAI